jgi:chorismate lyase/3-hydroxybenzoate synthase
VESLLGFGAGLEAGGGLRLAVPVLGGAAHETLFGGLAKAGRGAGFELFESADWLVGVRLERTEAGLGALTEAIYAELLALCAVRRRKAVRIWNYVPGINAVAADGMEGYRDFCVGRARAFERAGWSGPLPAASAVGGPDGVIALMFAAARGRQVARENPEQVPAYEYPPRHGPRSPSFSRAMQVEADGRRWTFVSGTAAIKGHETVAADSLAGQIDCTLDNLRLISEACGLGASLGADRAAERHFKVYLRNAEDLAATRAALTVRLLRPADRVAWLRSDICRSALKLEIEATVIEQAAH